MKNKDRLFRSIVLAALLLAAGTASAFDVITGAGATFPLAVYTRWADAYEKQTGIRVDYAPVGSIGGIKQVLSNDVDFGATDTPMTEEELEKNGLIQMPTVVGGVVPVINLDGVAEGQLKLSGDVLADIFLGKITRWNDARIATDNNGVKLPNQEITVIHRADGSGMTFYFTSYLSQISPEWKSSIGAGVIVPWKVGIGANTSESVASYVKNIRGSIGYLEYASVMKKKMNYAQLKNRDGNFVKPGAASFRAASIDIQSSKCFCESMINKPGKDAWPIANATFILVHKSWGARKVLKFFDWAYEEEGDKMALDLGYVELPEEAQKNMQGIWWSQTLKEIFKMPWK